MGLADELREITRKRREQKYREAERASVEYLQTLSTKLKEVALRGRDSCQVDFTGRDDLSMLFIRDELYKEGFVTEKLEGNRLLISWKEDVFYRG